MLEALAEIRKLAESDLITFVKLVAPYNVMGSCHTNPDGKNYKLVLYPRAHRKSFYAACEVAWEIVKDPSIAIVYLSATSDLAEYQLRAIKGILDSPIVRRYWPELIDIDEGKREKWTSTEICVDDPRRKEQGTRERSGRNA